MRLLARQSPSFLLCALLLSWGSAAFGLEVRSLDPSIGGRYIPSLAAGGTVLLSEDQIIDVMVLGDGYLESEREEFFDAAANWYTKTIGSSAIAPYPWFSSAFRVRAVFAASTNRATVDRDSYYRLKISETIDDAGLVENLSVSGSGWWNSDTGAANADFRQRVFEAIDALGADVNLRQYGAGTGANRRYSNLVMVMLIVADPSGRAVDALENCRDMCGVSGRAVII